MPAAILVVYMIRGEMPPPGHAKNVTLFCAVSSNLLFWGQVGVFDNSPQKGRPIKTEQQCMNTFHAASSSLLPGSFTDAHPAT